MTDMPKLVATPDTLEQRLVQYIAEAADIEEAEVDLDANLVDDLGLDSMGIVGVFIDIAYDYGIDEPGTEEDMSVFDTPRKICAYARDQLNAHDNRPA